MPKTALVLAGGGSRGAYEIGVWRALRELDESFELVTGTSVGAINAAVAAQGSEELAERLWLELETSHVFDVDLDDTLPQKQRLFSAVRAFGRAAVREGGAGTQSLEKLLRSYLNEDTVRSSPVDVGIVTVRMDSMKPVYLWKNEIPNGRLVDYLIASSSVFPAVRPCEIDGKKYIDGGFSDNMPVRMALDRGAERIIAVNMDAIGVVRREKAFASYDIREIKSYWNLGPMLLFDPNSTRMNLRLGYLDAMRSYGIFDGCAYAFARGTLAEAVRKYYGGFYEIAGLLGLESTGHKILPSVAYRTVEKRVFRRGIRPSLVRGFTLDGMEGAAEIFALPVSTIYTLDRLNERLALAVREVSPAASGTSDGQWQENAFLAALAALDSSGRPARTAFLARVIRDTALAGLPCPMLATAALLTDEWSAALYLALAGLVS